MLLYSLKSDSYIILKIKSLDLSKKVIAKLETIRNYISSPSLPQKAVAFSNPMVCNLLWNIQISLYEFAILYQAIPFLFFIFSNVEYEITAITGDKKGAGTDANVFVTIYGQAGITEKLSLKSRSKNVFERNRSDIFTMKAKCVGEMKKIRVEHDNTGTGPGWYLERVSLDFLLSR